MPASCNVELKVLACQVVELMFEDTELELEWSEETELELEWSEETELELEWSGSRLLHQRELDG